MPAETVRADPADGAAASETEAAVQKALGSLDEEYRAILVLRDMQQCDYHDIAEILNIPPGTVKSRLHRARLIMRDKLKLLLKS